MNTVYIRCFNGTNVRTLLYVCMVDGEVYLAGTAEWVLRCYRVRDRTPHDGIAYLEALLEEFPDNKSGMAYGAPFAHAS